jgi:hypothetical protein
MITKKNIQYSVRQGNYNNFEFENIYK